MNQQPHGEPNNDQNSAQVVVGEGSLPPIRNTFQGVREVDGGWVGAVVAFLRGRKVDHPDTLVALLILGRLGACWIKSSAEPTGLRLIGALAFGAMVWTLAATSR